MLDLMRLRPILLHPIEALEPWKEDRRHVVSDVPALAASVLMALRAELAVDCCGKF
jgi:hypothetical protein